MRRWVLPLIVMALAVPAAPAYAQDPSVARPGRWPSPVVTYRDESGVPASVREAVREWNAATTRVRLVRVRRGRRPQLRIIGRNCPAPIANICGFYPPDGRVFIGSGRGKRADDRPDSAFDLSLIAHEIGHGLGLVHTTRCGVMYPTDPLSTLACRPRDRRTSPFRDGFRCGPQPVDARALVKIYGGRVRRPRTLGWCPPYRYAKPPAVLADLVAPTGEIVIKQLGYPVAVAVEVVLRNRSTWAWGTTIGFPGVFGDAELRPVDAAGAPSPYLACNGRTTIASIPHEGSTVARGATTTFALSVCPSGEAGSGELRLRLVASSQGGDRPGPVFTLPWRLDRVPAASFTLAPAGGSIAAGTNTVTFTDTSTDDRGAIASREWAFGDDPGGAPPASGVTVTHTYTQPGVYSPVLTVTDGAGQQATAQQTVEITE